MVIGIVGSESAKFTHRGKRRAKAVILSLLKRPGVTEVVSGRCHLGGIDIWAIQIGEALGLKTREFKPKYHSWQWYKKRNLRIADRSDEVHCITVRELPRGFQGMRFPICYHCKDAGHIKSGGCWTMHQAIKLGKVGKIHIVRNY